MLVSNHHPFAVEFMRHVADPAWRWGNDMLEPNDLLAAAETFIIPLYERCGESGDWDGTPFFINLQIAFVHMRATETELAALKRLEDICRELIVRKFPVLALLPATTHMDDLTLVTANFISARARQERFLRTQKNQLARLRERRPTPLNLARRLATWISVSINAAAVERVAHAPSNVLAIAIADCIRKERYRASEERTTISMSAQALANFARKTFGLDFPERLAAG